MKKAILATKVGMTQIFDENGVLVPVTVLQAGPCVVTQVKTVENDGYDAIQVGFGEKKERITTKDVSGKKVIRNPHGAGKAEAGKDIEIWGDPQISRDIIYVKDVARAFVLALRSDKTYGLYNMTSGTELTLEEQVQTVIDVFGPGKGSKIVYRPDKPNNTPSFLFDMTKAKEDFGFVPEYLSYRAIMEDYKKELESGSWDKFIASRRKDK